MPKIVVADVEGDLAVYLFSRDKLAEMFAKKLNDGGYRAEAQFLPGSTNGDGELLQILCDEIGPDAAKATFELVELEASQKAIFEKQQMLLDEIADAHSASMPGFPPLVEKR